MSTNSTIAARFRDGKIYQSYIHWDGHVDTAGRTLFECYQNQELIEELLNLGGLSELGERIGEKLPFGQRDPGACVAYLRDKGEDSMEKREVEKEFTERQEEYNYFWNGEFWTCKEVGRLNEKNTRES